MPTMMNQQIGFYSNKDLPFCFSLRSLGGFASLRESFWFFSKDLTP